MPTIPYKNKDGKRLKGATTIKGQNVGWGKNPLMWWANNQGLQGKTLQESYDTATIPGTIAHYLVECHLKEDKPDLSQYEKDDIRKAMSAYNNFLEWTKQFKFRPLAVEPNLISELYQFGGTPDVFGFVMDKLCLIDWKTGKIYEDIFLQLAAYEQLWLENRRKFLDGPVGIEGFHVLRMPRHEETPSFHHSYWEFLPLEAWEAFECALKLSRYEKVLKGLL